MPDRFHSQGTIFGLASRLPAPIPGQGQEGIYLDVLLNYAAADVPTSADQHQFRVKRYAVLAMPARRFCAKITGY